jgi:hypothetical protein
MKRWVAIFVFAGVCCGHTQITVTPYQALHPIMKDPRQRNAPTSLNQYPGELSTPSAPVAVAPPKPAVVISRIDSGLAVSPLTLLGTTDGLKGRLYVTNIGSQAVTPLAQFMVCDGKGFQVGLTSKKGEMLAPEKAERIEVLATNLNAADLKLMKLTAKK